MDGFLRRHNCSKVLEVACGTGRLTTLLEDNGYEVTGLDISQDLLDIAKERCIGDLLRQDMRDIRVERPFDALLCLGENFGYMSTYEDVDKAFQSFNLSLRKGGILILDIFNAERTQQHQFGEWRRDVFEFEDMTITRLSRSSDYWK